MRLPDACPLNRDPTNDGCWADRESRFITTRIIACNGPVLDEEVRLCRYHYAEILGEGWTVAFDFEWFDGKLRLVLEDNERVMGPIREAANEEGEDERQQLWLPSGEDE